MTAIEVSGLVKRYRGGTGNAVDGVSFTVPDGALFCLLGPNGAGKTTTVSILTTTLAPTAGRVRIAGHELGTDPLRVRRDIGIVFQQPSLDGNLTAEENIRLHAVLYGLYPWRPTFRMMPRGYREHVAALAEVLDVGDVLRRRACTLSGGTRRKLEIVRALLHRPRVLFLDEPTVGLDPESRRSLWDYLGAVRDRHRTTVFLTTHYLAEAEAADTVCVLVAGRVAECGSPAQIKTRYARPELVLDARDRNRLRTELGLPATARAPYRVPLNGRSAQQVIRGLESELTLLGAGDPTLEDAYLRLLAGARP